MSRIDETTLKQVVAELGEDGVWVAPALRDEVTPEQEAQIEAAVADAATPTYVTLVQVDHRDPLTGGDAEGLANLIRDDSGRAGIYIGLAPHYGSQPRSLEINSFPDDSSLFHAAAVAAAEEPEDLTAQTLRTLELLESGEGEQLYSELDPSERYPGSSAADEGAGAGAVLGALGALVAIAAAVLAVRRRRRRTVAPRAGGASFTLPPAVLSTVRAAEDRRNEARARADVLALGEAIDAAELDARAGAALPAWQAALDHYDVARRILDRRHSPADVVGAIVLAERGRSALTAAVAGRGWTPSTRCYFNPLHEGPAAPLRWRDGTTWVRVPACARCAPAAERGEEPDDVLDFVADGRPVHYFKLDLGAWSRTGYGSLDTDLLVRLLDRR